MHVFRAVFTSRPATDFVASKEAGKIEEPVPKEVAEWTSLTSTSREELAKRSAAIRIANKVRDKMKSVPDVLAEESSELGMPKEESTLVSNTDMTASKDAGEKGSTQETLYLYMADKDSVSVYVAEKTAKVGTDEKRSTQESATEIRDRRESSAERYVPEIVVDKTAGMGMAKNESPQQSSTQKAEQVQGFVAQKTSRMGMVKIESSQESTTENCVSKETGKKTHVNVIYCVVMFLIGLYTDIWFQGVVGLKDHHLGNNCCSEFYNMCQSFGEEIVTVGTKGKKITDGKESVDRIMAKMVSRMGRAMEESTLEPATDITASKETGNKGTTQESLGKETDQRRSTGSTKKSQDKDPAMMRTASKETGNIKSIKMPVAD